MEHQQAVQNLAVECYLLGEMTLAEREAFEQHYFECQLCANDLRAAAVFLEEAKSAWNEPAQPVRVAAVQPSASSTSSWWSWLDWLQPRIAAPAMAALLLAAGFSLSRNVRLNAELEQANAPRTVPYTVLRPPTRGDAPVILAGGQPVMLQFLLPEISSKQLQFVVKSDDGREQFRVPGEAPVLGDPVTLSIPRFDLAPGRYTLIVEAPDLAEAQAPRYPLEVRRP